MNNTSIALYKVVVAFPCTGKSTLANKYPDLFVDLDIGLGKVENKIHDGSDLTTDKLDQLYTLFSDALAAGKSVLLNDPYYAAALISRHRYNVTDKYNHLRNDDIAFVVPLNTRSGRNILFSREMERCKKFKPECGYDVISFYEDNSARSEFLTKVFDGNGEIVDKGVDDGRRIAKMHGFYAYTTLHDEHDFSLEDGLVRDANPKGA